MLSDHDAEITCGRKIFSALQDLNRLPYSKYNPIERCWGILEKHWNGTLLDDRTTVLEWARSMTWKGISPVVNVLDRVYQTGVKITKKAFQPIANRLQRNPEIPKYAVTIVRRLT